MASTKKYLHMHTGCKHVVQTVLTKQKSSTHHHKTVPRISLNLEFLQSDDIKYISVKSQQKHTTSQSHQQNKCICIHYIDDTYDELCMCNEQDVKHVYNLILDTLKNRNQYIDM